MDARDALLAALFGEVFGLVLRYFSMMAYRSMASSVSREWLITAPSLWCGVPPLWRVPLEIAPPLPRGPLDGSFGWLPTIDSRVPSLAFQDWSNDDVARVEALVRKEAVSLPVTFARFMTSPAIHRRVLTSGGAYLDFGRKLVVGPDAVYLRFMNEGQGCAYWYLRLASDGSHAVAWAFPERPDSEDVIHDEVDDFVNPTSMRLCADDFEEFVCRFWCENAIWYVNQFGGELSKPLRDYEAATNAIPQGAFRHGI